MSFALSCEVYLDIARPLAGAFLWLAFAAAIVETAVTLWAKWKAIKAGKTVEPKTVADPDAWTKFLEALAVYHLPGLDKASLKSLRFLDLESTALLKAASPQ